METKGIAATVQDPGTAGHDRAAAEDCVGEVNPEPGRLVDKPDDQ